MTISHRGADASATPSEASKSLKVARLACCCKLSDLLPLVRQLHESVRTTTAREESHPEAA
ncbi:hypothetical protein SAMN00120144_1225 [Hymenobacter roseosalivarius DSM 11622]|uniref:Uncharacterized protein n=1 Tax=Hymenobacter roseosalivarius DSM 11622 TaxID=645990 RepID=A0A1W1V5Q3_9BACT|nr:hypothetical protein [Hymenobacter roseosalivarius]SMB88371.1 hypothetical protein SAMN00120144_1225 [Hymenobacter roseosalivarius DSM 11622]